MDSVTSSCDPIEKKKNGPRNSLVARTPAADSGEQFQALEDFADHLAATKITHRSNRWRRARA
jgi:hypothetical protein